MAKLPEFKGFTVDKRLKQFRKFKLGELPEIIDFDSPKGERMLAEFELKKTYGSVD